MKRLILFGSLTIALSFILAGGKCQRSESSELKPVVPATPKTQHTIDDKPTALPPKIERKPTVGDIRKTEDVMQHALAKEESLVDLLAGAEELLSHAQINSVNCDDQKCTIEAASLTEDITAMQPAMLSFVQTHREFGETITFFQDEEDDRITFFVITK